MSKTETGGKKKNLLQRTADKLGRKKKKKSKSGKSSAKEKSDNNDIESGRSTELDFTHENEPETLVSAKKLHSKTTKKEGQSRKTKNENNLNRKSSNSASMPKTTIPSVPKTATKTSTTISALAKSAATSSKNNSKFSIDTLRWEGNLADPIAENERIQEYKEKRRRRYEEAARKMNVVSSDSTNPIQEEQKVNLPGLTISQQADSKLNKSVRSVNLPSLVNHTPISSY